MANKYRILVEAAVKGTELQKDLDKKSENLVLKINHIDVSTAALDGIKTQLKKVLSDLNIDTILKESKQTTGGGGGGKQATPTTAANFSEMAQKIAAVNSQIESIRSSFTGLGDVSVKAAFDVSDDLPDLRKYQVSINSIKDDVQQITSFYVTLDKEGKQVLSNANQLEKSMTKIATNTQKTTEDWQAEWRNRLKAMTIGKESLLEKTPVADELTKLNMLIDQFGTTGKVRIEDVKQQFGTFGNKLKEAVVNVRANKFNVTDFFKNFTYEMGVAIQRTVEWASAMTLLYGTLRKIQEGIQYIKDLNKEMTNVGMVTGATKETMGDMAVEYNDLAEELGITTLEVAKGNIEWLRQGKTAEESEILLKNSLMMGKIAAIDQAQATEYLTSMLNGFKLEAEDASLVVDKLVAIDNAYATSVAEIADGMQRSSVSAQQAGVTFDELASYIAVVSSVSRKSASSIGESFKTMFARMQNIKLGQAFEDDATTISDVEEALAHVDIKLRDVEKNFKPLDVILGEVADKWETMDTMERSAVANAIAGVRQRENFLILMTNYNKVLEAQQIESEAAGLSLLRYSTYLDSVEAAGNKTQVALEKLWQRTITDDVIKQVYNATTAVITFITETEAIVPVLTTILGLLTILKSVEVTKMIKTMAFGIGDFVVAMKEAKLSVASFDAVVASAFSKLTLGNVLGIAITAIGALVLAINYLNSAWERTQRSFQESTEVHERNLAELERIATEYETLAKKENKSLADKQRLADIQGILNTKYSDGSDKVDILTGAYDRNTESINNNIKALKEKEKKESEAYLIYNKRAYQEAKTFMETPPAYTVGAPFGREEFVDIDLMAKPKQMLEDLLKYTASEDQVIAEWAKKSYDELKKKITAYDEIIAQYEQAKRAVEDYGKAEGKTLGKTPGGGGEGVWTFEEEYNRFTGAIDKVISATDTYMNQQSLTMKNISDLKGQYKDYTKYLYIENGQIKLSTDKLREYAIAQLEASIETAKKNGVAEEEIGIMKNQVDYLKLAIPLSKDFAKTTNQYLEAVKSKMGASTTFDQLGNSITMLDRAFADGTISANEYFSALDTLIRKTDMKETFGENTEAANIFFTGMVVNATQALSQISSMFDSGRITLAEYTSQITDLSGVFLSLSDTLLNSASSLGITGSAFDSLQQELLSSMGLIADTQEQLRNMQETIDLTSAAAWGVKSGDLQKGTEEYTRMMNEIAKAAYATGQTFTDMQGNALTSAEQIADYLLNTEGGFTNFTNQLANQVGNMLTSLVHQIGGLLVKLGGAIGQMKFSLSVVPKQEGLVDFPISIMGKTITGIKIPSIAIDFGEGAQAIGGAIAGFGQELMSQQIKLDLSSFTIEPVSGAAGLGKIKSAAESAGGALKELEDQWKATDKAADEAEKSYQDLLKKTIAMLKKKKEDEKEALQDQLEGYKKLIDAQKELIDQKEKEREFNEKVADKNKEITDINRELAELQFDTSEEATARRLELEEQLAEKQKDLDDIQHDRSVDLQKDALDKEYERFKEYIDKKIEAIDDYLEQEGTITAEAIRLLSEKSASFYNELLQWNRVFGSGVDSDIVDAWNRAITAVGQYKSAVGNLASYLSTLDAGNGSGTSGGNTGGGTGSMTGYWDWWKKGGGGNFHSGIDEGVVGGLKEGEKFIKVMKGEVVVNPLQQQRFVEDILPKITATAASGNLYFDNLLNVEGSVTQDTLPAVQSALNSAVNKILETLKGRGYVRGATSLSV